MAISMETTESTGPGAVALQRIGPRIGGTFGAPILRSRTDRAPCLNPTTLLVLLGELAGGGGADGAGVPDLVTWISV